MGRITRRARVRRIGPDDSAEQIDTLAVEEPLEIRWRGRPLAVTMRTPGHDLELVHGWLHAEGLITTAEDLRTVRFCAGSAEGDEAVTNQYNVLDVTPSQLTEVPPTPRSFVTSSACGVCGTDSIEALRRRGRFDPRTDRIQVAPRVLSSLPEALREGQRVFASTGGVHAAGLFTAAGERLVVREDVGRHNSVDKAVGWALLAGRLPLTGTILQVSGRASFELVQKAYLAGIPVLSAVSAPSSLAVELAAATGVTLAGFVRDGGLNVYAGGDRVTDPG